jgi:uncharacterized membrane protein
MVDIERSEQKTGACFVLRPNRSISWRGILVFFLALVLVSGSVAITLTVMGYWLVLPFTGLELILVALSLYWASRQSWRREVIRINADTIKIEKGWRYPEQKWILTRVWAQVVLERCPKQWYPSRLMIRSHGQVVEIGRFLNENERNYLASELRRSL